jgi:hypothetical protein
LGDVQLTGGVDKVTGGDHRQKGAGELDVHGWQPSSAMRGWPYHIEYYDIK